MYDKINAWNSNHLFRHTMIKSNKYLCQRVTQNFVSVMTSSILPYQRWSHWNPCKANVEQIFDDLTAYEVLLNKKSYFAYGKTVGIGLNILEKKQVKLCLNTLTLNFRIDVRDKPKMGQILDFQSPRKTFFRYYLSSVVCMHVGVYVGMYVCFCDFSHTVQPRTFKFWHNIPYVNI